MSMDARNRMIDAFSNDPAVTVFLMSLKAGGVALNLTAASHVMLMDPWCAQLQKHHCLLPARLFDIWKLNRRVGAGVRLCLPHGHTFWVSTR